MDSCNLLCLVAAGFFGSMLYVMLSHKSQKSSFNRFLETLTPEQKIIYNKIIRERTTIYIYGLVLGLLAGFTYISYIPLRNTIGICTFVVIILGFLYLFYSLHPKTDYMLNHLTTSEQNTAWLEIYREMKNRSHVGFILGAVAFILIGCALRK